MNPDEPTAQPVNHVAGEEYAAQVDASKGFAANGTLFEAAAVELVGPWKAAYDAAPNADKREILATARDKVGQQFEAWDEKFGWDFPNMADRYEDFFLYAYGQAKAAAVLTGNLRSAFANDQLYVKLGYANGRAG